MSPAQCRRPTLRCNLRRRMTAPTNALAGCLFALVGACGSTQHDVAAPSMRSATSRFVDILAGRGSHFGVGQGCDEWRAEPPSDDVHHDDGLQRGVLARRVPDAEGRIFAFSYVVTQDRDTLRMHLTGRGGYSYAEGVIVRSPNNPGYAVIGVGSYCIVEVNVRDHASEADAVVVGDETWFLSRDACMRSRTASQGRSRGCSKS